MKTTFNRKMLCNLLCDKPDGESVAYLPDIHWLGITFGAILNDDVAFS